MSICMGFDSLYFCHCHGSSSRCVNTHWVPSTWVCCFVVLQSPSRVQLFSNPWTAARQASLSLTSPRVCPSPCSLHRWCHPISSSDALFSCPQSFPASVTFPHRLSASDDQNTGASASASVHPLNIQGWSSLKLPGLTSLLSQGTFRSLLQHHSSKASILWPSAFFTVQLSQPNMTTRKTIALTMRTFVGRVVSLLSTRCWTWVSQPPNLQIKC